MDERSAALRSANLVGMTELIRLSRGLYRPSEQLTDLDDLVAAHLSALSDTAVVGGITAGRLHGLWLPEPAADERIELLRTKAGAPARQLARCRRREIRPRRRALERDEILVTDRFLTTTVPRTWVDLAETLSVEDLVAAGDSALRGGTTLAELREAVRRAHRRRGVLRAREALTLLDADSRSRGESHLRCIIVRAGLPKPEVNKPISDQYGEWLAEPDLHYKRARLALEYNGAVHAEVDNMRADITREIDIDQNDWKVVVFGPRQVFGRPWQIPPYVRGMLARRDPEWAARAASSRRKAG